MAKSLLALVVIVVVTIQVAFATYPSKVCDPPHRIEYGRYSPYRPKYSVGSRIEFHCDKGYKLYGSSWTVCKWDKRSYWEHPSPVCKRIGCSYLKAPQYGKVRIDGYGLSSVAYYSCDHGYDLHGPSSRKCLHDGSWYGDVPVCRPKRKDCHKLHAPQYGKVRVTGYGPDSIAYYSCDYGYDLHGVDSRKCLYDGSWYGKAPICRPRRKDCSKLYAPKYGKVRVTGYGHNSIAYYSCDYGYDLHGVDSRKCLYDGSWYGKAPICRPRRKDCSKLYAPKYGKVRVTGYGHNSIAYYSCDYGYDLHGVDSRKCLYDGSWYGKAPICRPRRKDCSKLYAPKYGKVRVTGYGHNSIAYYSCDYGYELYGPSSRKCQYDGSWYGKVPVCRPNRRNCPKLYAPKYGKVRVTGYGHNSIAYYSCDYGYELYGSSSRKCQYDGSWYGKVPVCRPNRRNCPKLYAPKYGKIRVTGYGHNSIAYYSCDHGYGLYGPSTRKCQYDGSWYGRVPVCRPRRRRVCPRLYAPRYGQIKVTGYGLDSKAHYSCDYGYKLYGLQWRKCLHDGSWYGKAPICRPAKKY